MTTPANPLALLRSWDCLRLLARFWGVPVSAAAYGFLAVVSYLRPYANRWTLLVTKVPGEAGTVAR